MNGLRPALTGMGPAPAIASAAGSATTAPAKRTPTMLANQVLKVLASRTGWTPAGVLREAINPPNQDSYKEAIRKLRATGLIESMGHTRWVQYRVTEKARGQAPTKSYPEPAAASGLEAESAAPEAGTETAAPSALAAGPAPDSFAPEILLMATLDQVVDTCKSRAGIDEQAIARATAWLASKHGCAA